MKSLKKTKLEWSKGLLSDKKDKFRWVSDFKNFKVKVLNGLKEGREK